MTIARDEGVKGFTRGLAPRLTYIGPAAAVRYEKRRGGGKRRWRGRGERRDENPSYSCSLLFLIILFVVFFSLLHSIMNYF